MEAEKRDPGNEVAQDRSSLNITPRYLKEIASSSELSLMQMATVPNDFRRRLLPNSRNFDFKQLRVRRFGGRVGLVVRALAFHQCGPGSISALGVIRGLSLLVLYSAMRGFPPGTPVFPSHQKPTFDLI